MREAKGCKLALHAQAGVKGREALSGNGGAERGSKETAQAQDSERRGVRTSALIGFNFLWAKETPD